MTSAGEFAAPDHLVLRSAPPPVLRLSRRAIATGAGVAATGLAAIAAWALIQHPRPAGQAVIDDGPATPSEYIRALPRDYAALPPGVPKLGAPLPGDLGKPILAARRAGDSGATSLGAGEGPQAASAAGGEASRLFAPSSPRSIVQSAGGALEAPGANPAGPSVTPAPEAVAADRRSGFLQGTNPPSVNPARLVPPAGETLLQAGTVIPAALMTGIRSDLPGQVVAQVTADVRDSLRGAAVLVPQGARLLGVYDSQVAFGQARVQLAWTRLVLPDGRSIDLGRQTATDAEGYSGLADRVDHKWRQIAGGALVSTVLGVGVQLGASNGDGQLVQALRNGTANAANQAGQQLVGKSLDVQPTLTIQPGFPVRAVLTGDLVLDPWAVR